MNKEVIMKRFLIKMINLDIWGGKHTELTNLKKCIAKHMRGDRAVDKAIKELVKLNFLNIKQSTGEIHLSLNPKKQYEIYKFIKQI